MEKEKRARASNFSKIEVKRLLELANRKSSISENKKTDAVSSKQKDETWVYIADQFNASSQGVVSNKISNEFY